MIEKERKDLLIVAVEKNSVVIIKTIRADLITVVDPCCKARR